MTIAASDITEGEFLVRTAGKFDVALIDAIKRRPDQHRVDSRALSIQSQVPG